MDGAKVLLHHSLTHSLTHNTSISLSIPVIFSFIPFSRGLNYLPGYLSYLGCRFVCSCNTVCLKPTGYQAGQVCTTVRDVISSLFCMAHNLTFDTFRFLPLSLLFYFFTFYQDTQPVLKPTDTHPTHLGCPHAEIPHVHDSWRDRYLSTYLRIQHSLKKQADDRIGPDISVKSTALEISQHRCHGQVITVQTGGESFIT